MGSGLYKGVRFAEIHVSAMCTDQRKGTRLIVLGQDRGYYIYIRGGNANEPGDDDGGPRQGSLSCLTISRKGLAAARPRLLLVGRVRIHQHNDPGIGPKGVPRVSTTRVIRQEVHTSESIMANPSSQ
jgi:hypothetical protein